MLTYIIHIMLFQILFLAVYDFFLSKETFHNYNRWYLLGTPILSFVLPLIKIPTIQKAVPQELMVYLPEIMLSPQKAIEKTSYYSSHSFSYLNLLFWLGVVFFSIIFLIKIRKIVLLIAKNEKINRKTYQLILLPKQSKAFSFFNFIFLGKKIPLDKQEKIIQHELVHAQQKHSIDLLFFELLRIVMWFNPMTYFYQRKISLLHEYISDAELVKTTEKHDYFNRLLSETFQVENLSFVNQFYKQSYLKKRITMMTKTQSNPFKKAKYLLLLPLLASMLIYTSCENNDTTAESLQQKQLQTRYSKVGDTFKVETGTVETYLDFYAGVETPPWKEVKVADLTPKEKEEADSFGRSDFLNRTEGISVKYYQVNSGRRVQAIIIDVSKMSKNYEATPTTGEDVPFAIIEEVPVYPGCTGTRKELTDCLNNKLRDFVAKRFNSDLTATLGLSKGKKRIVVQFRIDKTGAITDIIARAPHPKLKAEIIRVIKELPKMQPGKQRGKTVGMKYTLPVGFIVK